MKLQRTRTDMKKAPIKLQFTNLTRYALLMTQAFFPKIKTSVSQNGESLLEHNRSVKTSVSHWHFTCRPYKIYNITVAYNTDNNI